MERPAGCTDICWRYENNPIIDRYGIPSSNSIFNSAVVPFKDGFAGVFRCDNKRVQMNIFAGFSKDGVNWVELDFQSEHRQSYWGNVNSSVKAFDIPAEKQAPYRRYKFVWQWNNQGNGTMKYAVQEVELFGDLVLHPKFVITIQ